MSTRIAEMPNWPAMMELELAAAYCRMGENTFRALAARKGVAPVDLGFQLTRWRKTDLDRLIDSLPVRGADTATDATAADPVELALEKVRRRARG